MYMIEILPEKKKQIALLKGPRDGYDFPVYATTLCPKNKAEWLERSFVLHCTDQNGYMCLPNEMLTELVEFCYTKDVIAIPKGKKCGKINEISTKSNERKSIAQKPLNYYVCLYCRDLLVFGQNLVCRRCLPLPPFFLWMSI